MLSELIPRNDGGVIKPRYLRLVNKFDYLSNGKSKTGYHTVQDLSLMMRQDELEVISVDYMTVLEAFKTSDNV